MQLKRKFMADCNHLRYILQLGGSKEIISFVTFTLSLKFLLIIFNIGKKYEFKSAPIIDCWQGKLEMQAIM